MTSRRDIANKAWDVAECVICLNDEMTKHNVAMPLSCWTQFKSALEEARATQAVARQVIHAEADDRALKFKLIDRGEAP